MANFWLRDHWVVCNTYRTLFSTRIARFGLFKQFSETLTWKIPGWPYPGYDVISVPLLQVKPLEGFVPNPDTLFYSYLQYIFWYGNKLWTLMHHSVLLLCAYVFIWMSGFKKKNVTGVVRRDVRLPSRVRVPFCACVARSTLVIWLLFTVCVCCLQLPLGSYF